MRVMTVPAHRRQFLADVSENMRSGEHISALLITIIACGATYGATIGAWRGAQMAAYAAIKIPLMLIATAVMTALFNWIVASLMGLPLQLRQTLALSLFPLAVAALIAASLAPITWFLTASLPPPSTSQRTVHNLLYLAHTFVIAGAGVAGTSFLGNSLTAVARGDRVKARRIHIVWFAAYAFVAGEVAWIFRPFIGSVYLPVTFMREDALRGNVYEFIWTDIIPHLLRRLAA
jgi:hypothetical protein